MNSTQLMQMQARDKRRKKVLAIDTELGEAFPLSANMDSATYTTTFNSYVTDLKRKEYKTKNPRMFTWNLRPHYMNKLTFLPQSDRPNFQLSSQRFPSESPRGDLKQSDSPEGRHSGRSMVSYGLRSTKNNKNGLEDTFRKTPMDRTERIVDIDVEKLETFYKQSPIHAKTTYPVAKVQTDLLKNHSEDVKSQIPNFKYMLNHFNKRNQAINKIISRVKPDEKQLDREDIIKEIQSNINGISRPSTLHKVLRPTTHTQEMRAKGPSPSKRFGGRTLTESNDKSKSGNAVELPSASKQMGQKKGFELNFGQVNPGSEEEIQRSTSIRERMMNRLASTRIKKEGSKELNSVTLNKKESETRRKKEDERVFLKGMEYGLQQLDVLHSARSKKGRMSPDELGSSVEKFKPFIRATTTMWKSKNEEEEQLEKIIKPIDDDNILYFNNYFKKKYMENGLSLEASPKLKNRVASLERDVKGAIKKVGVIDLKQVAQ